MYIKENDCDHLQLTINVIAANLILQEMQIRMQICKFLPSNNSSQHIMWGKRGSKHHRFNNAWLLFSISTICYIWSCSFDWELIYTQSIKTAVNSIHALRRGALALANMPLLKLIVLIVQQQPYQSLMHYCNMKFTT